ncbi:MAG: MoaD/ThiS family protein [Candidatus Kariarchaeaceae archaeon]|jgi:molybdopterin converting factor small subunit
MSGEFKILFQATFREIAGRKEIIESLEGDTTVGSVVEKLANSYGKDFNIIIDPKTGSISTDILVMLNGRGVRSKDTKLNVNDVLMFTIPIGGG